MTTIFTSRSRDIIIDIFLSFVAEANANAILYIFHFQTLHTVFLVMHSLRFKAEANTTELLPYFLFLEVDSAQL